MVTVKMKPTSVIKARLGINPGGKVQKYFTKRCADYMDKYVPEDIGTLKNTKEIGINKVTYIQPYSHYQYKGLVITDGKVTSKLLNYKTPGTGSYWDKKMWAVDGEEVLDEVQKYMERGGK